MTLSPQIEAMEPTLLVEWRRPGRRDTQCTLITESEAHGDEAPFERIRRLGSENVELYTSTADGFVRLPKEDMLYQSIMGLDLKASEAKRAREGEEDGEGGDFEAILRKNPRFKTYQPYTFTELELIEKLRLTKPMKVEIAGEPAYTKVIAACHRLIEYTSSVPEFRDAIEANNEAWKNANSAHIMRNIVRYYPQYPGSSDPFKKYTVFAAASRTLGYYSVKTEMMMLTMQVRRSNGLQMPHPVDLLGTLGHEFAHRLTPIRVAGRRRLIHDDLFVKNMFTVYSFWDSWGLIDMRSFLKHRPLPAKPLTTKQLLAEFGRKASKGGFLTWAHIPYRDLPALARALYQQFPESDRVTLAKLDKNADPGLVSAAPAVSPKPAEPEVIVLDDSDEDMEEEEEEVGKDLDGEEETNIDQRFRWLDLVSRQLVLALDLGDLPNIGFFTKAAVESKLKVKNTKDLMQLYRRHEEADTLETLRSQLVEIFAKTSMKTTHETNPEKTTAAVTALFTALDGLWTRVEADEGTKSYFEMGVLPNGRILAGHLIDMQYVAKFTRRLIIDNVLKTIEEFKDSPIFTTWHFVHVYATRGETYIREKMEAKMGLNKKKFPDIMAALKELHRTYAEFFPGQI